MTTTTMAKTPLRDLIHAVSKYNASFFNRCLVFTSSSKRKIRIFTWWSCNDGKEMYKAASCECTFFGGQSTN